MVKKEKHSLQINALPFIIIIIKLELHKFGVLWYKTIVPQALLSNAVKNFGTNWEKFN